ARVFSQSGEPFGNTEVHYTTHYAIPAFRRYITHGIPLGMKQDMLLDYHCPFNTGIFGGNDLVAIHDYAARAMRMVWDSRNLWKYITAAAAITCPEQYWLASYVKARGIPMECLLPDWAPHEAAKAAGYIHLM